jgi:hypothetical protein
MIQPGNIVLTTYGVAVVISSNNHAKGETDNSSNCCNNAEGFIFKARIWRQPGKSMASSATAYLHTSSVIRELPAAPGMTTEIASPTVHKGNQDACLVDSNNKEEGGEEGPTPPNIMIYCYSGVTDEYIVSHVQENDETEKTHLDLIEMFSNDDDDDEQEENVNEKRCGKEPILFHLKSEQVAKAKCAKYYPLLDDLICRGTEAGVMAQSVIRNNPKLHSWTDALAGNHDDIAAAAAADDDDDVLLSSSKNESVSTGITKVVQVTDKVTGKLKEVLSDSKEVNGIYQMLKDEDLEVLLRNGRDRLRYLVSGGLKESTKHVLKDMGLEVTTDTTDGGDTMSSTITKAQEKALAALDELLEDNFNVDLENAQKVMGDKFEEMFHLVANATNSDGTLEKILEDIREKTSEWQVQTGRLLSTKSSSIFVEGAKRFQARVGNLLSPKQFALLEKSGAGLTKAFTEGDIALAKLKSIELGESVRSRLFCCY